MTNGNSNAAPPRLASLVILTFEIYLQIIRGNYCSALKNFVPLQCQIEEVERGGLRVKIARFKYKNCAH